jgi:hypothetical protein
VTDATDRSGLSGEALGRATFEQAKINLQGVPSERIRSMSAEDLAILAKISRSALYQNKWLRAWLETEHGRGIKGGGAQPQSSRDVVDEAPKARNNNKHLFEQINVLQRENTKLKAELAELRSKIFRFKHIEKHLALTGRMPR